MSDEKEIARVRESDRGRGKKTADNLLRKRKRLESLLLTALQNGNRQEFAEILIDLGQPIGSDEHEKSMKLFDEYQSKR
jgi:hypothetical protein